MIISLWSLRLPTFGKEKNHMTEACGSDSSWSRDRSDTKEGASLSRSPMIWVRLNSKCMRWTLGLTRLSNATVFCGIKGSWKNWNANALRFWFTWAKDWFASSKASVSTELHPGPLSSSSGLSPNKDACFIEFRISLTLSALLVSQDCDILPNTRGRMAWRLHASLEREQSTWQNPDKTWVAVCSTHMACIQSSMLGHIIIPRAKNIDWTDQSWSAWSDQP